jgi:hypothetical protein
VSTLPTINETVQVAVPTLTTEQRDALVTALTNREDMLAGLLHMAGAQFGLYPEIIAHVFADLGVGTPITDAHREMIRSQFNALMERLQREQQGGQ